MSILILGANGQIGSALSKLLGSSAIALTREQADLAKPDTLVQALTPYNPTCIINAAAYTAVDKAESEPKLAHLINAESPGGLAQYAKKHNALLVHYSTDYVFNGSGDKPWLETDTTAPLNIYGKSKLQGEQNIQKEQGKHLIFRTSWVYDEAGKNFLTTMLRLGAEKESLNIVSDQYGAPSYALNLAQATLDAVERFNGQSGIYHMCNSGTTNWHAFANAIFEQAKHYKLPLTIQHTNSIATDAYPTPAKRPLNSRLNCTKLQTTFNITLPTWQDALQACMKEKYGNH